MTEVTEGGGGGGGGGGDGGRGFGFRPDNMMTPEQMLPLPSQFQHVETLITIASGT